MRGGVRLSLGRLALWLLAVFVFSFPSQGVVSIPGVGSLSRLIGVVAFVAGVASLVGGGRVRFRAPSLFLVLALLFTLWAAVTFFWSIDPGETIGRVSTYAQLAVLVWLAHQLVRDDRDLDFLWQAFVLGCYVMIGIGITAFLSGGGEFRNVGGFNANGFAIVSALGIPMAWGLSLRRAHRLLQPLNVAYPWLALLAVMLGASRGGLLTALVALLVVPLLFGRLGVLPRFALFVAIAAGAWIGFDLIPTAFPTLQANIERLGEVDEQLMGGTLTGRTDIWAAGFQVYRTSPVVGVGMGGFNRAIQPIHGSARSPHNAFLSVAVGSGAIGLLLFLGLMIVPLVGVLANPARRVEHLVLYMALVVSMMPTNSDDDKYVWFILAALAAARPVVVVLDREPAGSRAGTIAGNLAPVFSSGAAGVQVGGATSSRMRSSASGARGSSAERSADKT